MFDHFTFLFNWLPPPSPLYVYNNRMCLFSSNDGIWSNEGCVRSEGNMTYSVCLCNHLTNFAILMQVVPLKVRVLAALLLLWCPKCSCLNGSRQPVVFSSAPGNLQGSAKQCWYCFVLACKKAVLTTSWWTRWLHIPSKTNTFENVLILFQLLHIIVHF